MKPFMDMDFLLESDAARTLYHNYAAQMPIWDYHCHVEPKDIAEDRQYDNITQLWLGGDHYKWRLMRWCGVEERLITGSAPDREKFAAFAACLPRAPGSPIVHWTHLELQRYFDCGLPLCPENANAIWEACNTKLQNGFSVRDIIARSNVAALCTTDDPTDTLEWHATIAHDTSFATKVYPTFRPDKALSSGKPGFTEYIRHLSEVAGHGITTLADLYAALSARLDHFTAHGCRIADHGLDAIHWSEEHQNAGAVFARALRGGIISQDDADAYQTALLLFLSGEYKKRGMVMQLHFGAIRDINPPMFRTIGPDTGFDFMGTPNVSAQLAALLGALAQQNALPRTILCSLNPADNAMLAGLAGSFQKSGTAGWVQHGSAWWFNDTKSGIESQLTSLAEQGVLGSFVGMLTDSRSFLSYTRHEYFRRILCNLLGCLADTGGYPYGLETLGELVRDVSYRNAEAFFF